MIDRGGRSQGEEDVVFVLFRSVFLDLRCYYVIISHFAGIRPSGGILTVCDFRCILHEDINICV